MDKILKDIRTYFTLLLVIPSIIFVYLILRYQVLPMKYLLVVLLLLVGACAILILSQYKTEKKGLQITGKVFIVLMCLILSFGNYSYAKTINLFSNVSEGTNTDVVSVVVMKESAFKYIDDLKGKIYSTLAANDEYIEKEIKAISKENNEEMNIKRFAGILTLTNALYSGEVNCMIINESYRSMIEEEYPTFSQDTRVIHSNEYKVKVVNPKEIDVTNDTFSVYISGIDTYGSISTKSRSDVNMIVTVNPRTKQILLTSIPRDFYIPFNVLNGECDKLTHSGLYGVDETKDNVASYFGIDINYFFRVNFSSVIDIVNAIGGINVDNPRAFGSFQQGNIHLNGEQALSFSRERYSFEEGDKERGRNQMRVITGIINKVISPAIITNYPSLLNSLSSSFQTDLTDDQIISLIRMQIDDMGAWDIQTISVDARSASLFSPIYGSNLSMMIPDSNSVQIAKERINQLYQ